MRKIKYKSLLLNTHTRMKMYEIFLRIILLQTYVIKKNL